MSALILLAPLAAAGVYFLGKWWAHDIDPCRGLKVTQAWLAEQRAADR